MRDMAPLFQLIRNSACKRLYIYHVICFMLYAGRYRKYCVRISIKRIADRILSPLPDVSE